MATTAGELVSVLPNFPAKDLSAFKVQSLLGGGGFAHVVCARDADGAEWALKLIPAPGATRLEDVDATPLLLSEARIHLLLSNEPSVLPCVEAFKSTYVDERSGEPRHATYMAVLRMPVAACSVEEWLFSVAPLRVQCGGGPQLQVDEREVLSVWMQMVNAVHRCHVNGVIHKDVKLPNFLMDRRGKVQIMDFGLAQVEGVSPRLVVGTPWTMSPAALKHGDDGRSGDWWSLGVVLYQLMQGGSWPFKQCWWPWQKGGERMEAAIRRAVLAGRISYRDASAVSEPVRALIRGLLQPDPNRRWQLRQVLASKAIIPALLEGIADCYPELRPDMEVLLRAQSRALEVMALGSDGGVVTRAPQPQPSTAGAGAGPASAVRDLLWRGASAVSTIAAEGGGLLRPGPHRHGPWLHGGGGGGAQGQSAYEPLLADEDGAGAGAASGAEAGAGAAASTSGWGPTMATAAAAAAPPAASGQSQPGQLPDDGVRTDDLLLMVPGELPRAHATPPATPRGAGRGDDNAVAAAGTTTTTSGRETHMSASASQPALSHRSISGPQTGDGPLDQGPIRSSPRGSRTSLADLFGAGHGGVPFEPSPSRLNQQQQQQQARTASSGRRGSLLGSAVDVLSGLAGGGGPLDRRSRRTSWALQWQPVSPLHLPQNPAGRQGPPGVAGGQQQGPLGAGAAGSAGAEGSSGSLQQGGAEGPVPPVVLPPSSWVPPPPEVFTSGKFDRRGDAASPVRQGPAGLAGMAPPPGRAGPAGSSPSANCALLLSPSRRILAKARRLFLVCLQKPGVKHDMYEPVEYATLAGHP